MNIRHQIAYSIFGRIASRIVARLTNQRAHWVRDRWAGY